MGSVFPITIKRPFIKQYVATVFASFPNNNDCANISTPHPPLGVYNSHCKCYFVSGVKFVTLSRAQLARVNRESILCLTKVEVVDDAVLLQCVLLVRVKHVGN